MKQLIYIAAPYTKGDVAENVHNAIKAADRLVDADYMVYVPHLTHFWHIMSPKPWEFWMELDSYILPFCSALLRLPGESTGADREVEQAKVHQIPIYYDIETLIKYLPRFV